MTRTSTSAEPPQDDLAGLIARLREPIPWETGSGDWQTVPFIHSCAIDEQREQAAAALSALQERVEALTAADIINGQALAELNAQREQAERELDEALAAGRRLADACNGVIGLVQLVALRDDLPPGLDDLMTLSHRMTEAKAAIELDSALARCAEQLSSLIRATK